MQQLVVKPETALVRPYVVAAILRGITFDPVRYNSFIDLQARGGGGRRQRARPWCMDSIVLSVCARFVCVCVCVCLTP